MRRIVAACLGVVSLATAVVLANRARGWNEELALAHPAITEAPPQLDDPHTPRLTDRVVLIIIDGLGADEAHLPYLDELRAHGVATTAHVPYPTISRPNYVTILTGVPPRDSGVRANRVSAPIGIDTVMDRAQAAGLRVATASDFGLLPSLFVRGASSLTGIEWIEHDTHVMPPPPLTWPVDEARRVDSLAELGPIIAELAAGDAAFIPVLVIDVDRAGHANGIGEAYRAAAVATDRMLRSAFAAIDLTRSTVIVVADHGHVEPGGHGGDEREVSTVPLVLAGRGIVAGATARDARSIDVAPTIAALLGVPAPGYAEGRALVEVLALDPSQAARREAVDRVRGGAVIARAEAARDASPRPEPWHLVALLAGLVFATAAAIALQRRSAIALGPASLAGVVAFVAMLIASVIMTRGHMSPSYIPTLARTERFGAIGASVAIALHLAASWLAVRRARDPLAAANATAFIGLAVALTCVVLVRAWFHPPHLDVPPPLWIVAVPALEIAAATVGVASALVLAFTAVRR